jgi:serine/threonine-protein kinase
MDDARVVRDGHDQIKVLDFGIAKLRPVDGQAATRTGSTFGTTHYMSPEQARGASEVDARTDVWSLGVVLYELLAGRKPFDGEQPLNIVHQILNATPTPLAEARPGLPRGLLAAVERAMKKDAGQRFPSIRAFMKAIEPFAVRVAADGAAAPVSTRPTPETTEQRAPRRAGRRLGTALAVGGVMGIAAVALVGLRDKPAAPPVAVAPAPAPTVPVVSPPPAVAPKPPVQTEPAKLSGQSEQSEQAEHAVRTGQSEAVPVAARRRREPAARRTDAPPPAVPATPPKKPALTLDPTPS